MTPPQRIEVSVGGAIAPVNAYILVGTPHTIVDPGPDTEIAYAALRDGLAGAGIGIASLEQIVITHGHVDHAGIAGRLSAESGARVLAHPEAIGDLVAFEAAWTRRTEVVMRAARAAGAPPEIRDAYLDIARMRRRLFGQDVPADMMVPLTDGTLIRAGGAGWRVMHTPGHSRDHIALAGPGPGPGAEAGTLIGALAGARSRVGSEMGSDTWKEAGKRTGARAGEGAGGEVIVGDLVMRGAPTMPALEASDPDAALPGTLDTLFASWRELGSLEAERAWPGHGPPIRAPRVLLARRIAHLRFALRETRTALQSMDLTPWEIAMRTGLSPLPERLLGTLGHVFSRLEWLSERGLVDRNRADGITRYRSVRKRNQPDH